MHKLARAVAEEMVEDDPKRLTLEYKKVNRGSKIYVDVNRNAYAQHAVAPYGVRAKPRAPVAVPIHWEELSDSKLKPDRWTVKTIGARIDVRGRPVEGDDAEGAEAAELVLDPLRVESRRGMDADHPQRLVARRLEAVDLAGANDHHVAGCRVDLLAVEVEVARCLPARRTSPSMGGDAGRGPRPGSLSTTKNETPEPCGSPSNSPPRSPAGRRQDGRLTAGRAS